MYPTCQLWQVQILWSALRNRSIMIQMKLSHAHMQAHANGCAYASVAQKEVTQLQGYFKMQITNG